MNEYSSGRKCLLSVHVTNAQWFLRGLEYSNGLLFISLGGNTEQAGICQLNPDGTGLRALVQDGATSINVIGEWRYYQKFGLWSTVEYEGLGGRDIARVRLDGSEREVLAQALGPVHSFDSVTVMPDCSIYYRECDNDFVVWRRIEDYSVNP